MCGLAWSASDSSHLSNEYEPNTGNSHERDGGCRLHVTDIMSWLLPTEVDCYMSAITRSPEGLDARRLDLPMWIWGFPGYRVVGCMFTGAATAHERVSKLNVFLNLFSRLFLYRAAYPPTPIGAHVALVFALVHFVRFSASTLWLHHPRFNCPVGSGLNI